MPNLFHKSPTGCISCNALIDEHNDSREHLIVNAIGGRLKVRGIVCSSCNSNMGEEWDSDLAKQLQPLSHLFAIRRERGEIPNQRVVTAAGDKLTLHRDGSLHPIPVHKVHKEGDDTRIEMRVETWDQAREILEKLKERRFPKLDVEKALAGGQIQETLNPVIKFDLAFGGPKAGRAAVKSALCLAVANGVNASTCTDAVDYLKRADATPCFGFFFERDVIQDRPNCVPLHCIAVSNRGTEGQLLAYLEYFGLHRIVVCLATRYTGPDVHCSYSIDPMTGQELKLDFHLGLSQQDVARCFNYECIPAGSQEAAAANVMPIAVEIGRKRALNNTIAEAIKFGWDNCGAQPGEMLTVEHMRKVSQLAAQRIVRFLLQNSYLRGQSQPVPAVV